MSTVGSERGLLRHPRLASLATAEWPAWLWGADGTRILWSNAAGAAIFGAANVKAATGRRFAMTDPPPAQVLRLAATLPSSGQERLERLRGFGGKLGRALTCHCSRIADGDGRGAVLIVAAEPAGPALPLGERVRRLLDDDGDGAAAFMPDGRLIYANAKAQAWLNGEACEVLVARLGEGPASVLLAVPQQPAAQAGQAQANQPFGTGIEPQNRQAEPPWPASASADGPSAKAATGP